MEQWRILEYELDILIGEPLTRPTSDDDTNERVQDAGDKSGVEALGDFAHVSKKYDDTRKDKLRQLKKSYAVLFYKLEKRHYLEVENLLVKFQIKQEQTKLSKRTLQFRKAEMMLTNERKFLEAAAANAKMDESMARDRQRWMEAVQQELQKQSMKLLERHQKESNALARRMQNEVNYVTQTHATLQKRLQTRMSILQSLDKRQSLSPPPARQSRASAKSASEPSRHTMPSMRLPPCRSLPPYRSRYHVRHRSNCPKRLSLSYQSPPPIHKAHSCSK